MALIDLSISMDMESRQASRAKGMALNTFREIGRIYLSKYPDQGIQSLPCPITEQQLGAKGVWACSPAARGENRSRWQGRRESWRVTIALTKDWRSLSYNRSDFGKTPTSQRGNVKLDLDFLDTGALSPRSGERDITATYRPL